MTQLVRAFGDGDLDVRGRTVVGYAVPFGIPANVSDDGRTSYSEQFERGAFTRTIAERGDRVKFLALHDRDSRLPLGRATVLREESRGLYAELQVSRTAAGDEALELIRDGSLDGLSVGFVPVNQRTERSRGGLSVTRTAVRLNEISAVPVATWDEARILAVRAQSGPQLTIAHRRLELARAAASPYLEN